MKHKSLRKAFYLGAWAVYNPQLLQLHQGEMMIREDRAAFEDDYVHYLDL